MMVEMKRSTLVDTIIWYGTREIIRQRIRDWLSDWWLLLVAFVLLAVGLGLIQRFELIGFESARWTLSALVQAGAALIGILFVALGLLWNQANQEREKLRGLMEGYVGSFAPNTVAVIDLHRTLCEAYRTTISDTSDFSQYYERAKMQLLKDTIENLIVLVYTAAHYLDVKVPLKEFLIGSHLEAFPTEEMEKYYSSNAVKLCTNEFRFFAHLMQFDDKLSLLADYAKLKNKGSPDMAEVLRRARSVDRVGDSIYRLRFFQAFTGRGLKAISCMWLLCIAIGILILLSIDRIPPNLLSGLAAIPIAVGIIAVGITLSLGLRAIRSG
jgi:hypothetical protein